MDVLESTARPMSSNLLMDLLMRMVPRKLHYNQHLPSQSLFLLVQKEFCDTLQ